MNPPEALALVLALDGRQRSPHTIASWSRWAASVYATTVRLAVVPVEIQRAPGVAGPGGIEIRPAEEAILRHARFARKEVALHLAMLALERATAQDGSVDCRSPWHAQAERWMATFGKLPGGVPPSTERSNARLEILRRWASAAELLNRG
jgi:hypothetical protein